MKGKFVEIRQTGIEKFHDIKTVEEAAFRSPVEAKIVLDLLNDPTAQPVMSLSAYEGERPVGHICLSRAEVEGHPVECLVLAPLAVVPDFQRKGIGSALMRASLEKSGREGIGLVFVLGHPGYYPRAGFINDAGALGFAAPYPIPETDKDAWMVCELRPELIGRVRGRVMVAESMMKPEYWRE